MDAIEYNWGGTQILQNWTPSAGGDGFDTASLRVDFRGSGAAFAAAYKIGNPTGTTGGAKMYYSGVQIEREAFGWTTGTVFAKGFWNADADRADLVATVSTSPKEKLWPFTNGGSTYFLPGTAPGVGKSTIYNAGNGNTFWRVRQITFDGQIDRQGYEIITNSATAWTGPPAVTNVTRPSGMGQMSVGLKDPLIATKSGWVSQGYSQNIVAVLGKVTLLSWRDSWKYIDKESE